MKYYYKFIDFVHLDKTKELAIEVDKQIDLVSDFLMFDIQGFEPNFALDKIDKVLNGESDYETISGNECYVEVRKDFTQITDMYSDDKEYSVIETPELREFIILWAKKHKEYYS